MSESITHMSYVSKIFEYVKQIVPKNNSSLIILDSPDSYDNTIPVINGFRPDLTYKINDTLILGEAKTDDDVERRHSLNQYYSYLKEADSFDGNAIVVFCVSWKMFSTIKNHLRYIRRQNAFNKVKIIVLNDKGDINVL